MGRRNITCLAKALLQRQRYEAQLTFGTRDQKQRRAAAVLLELVDLGLEVVGTRNRFLRDLDDRVARVEALVGGGRARVDAENDDALHGVLDFVLLAQVVAHIGELEAEGLLDDRLSLGRIRRRRQRCLLLAVLQPSKLDRLGLFAALANDLNLYVLPDRRVGDDARQIAHFLDVLAVELDDHIARLDAAGLRRPLLVDASHERAVGRLDAEALGDLVGHLLDAHAKPAAPGLAEILELIDHRKRSLRWHREADADGSAGGRDDCSVDADDLALEVEQWTARIAAIDGGVGLDVVVVGTGVDVAIARRDDAGRDSAAEAERVADRDHPFAEPQTVGIPELDRLELLVGLDAQEREVGLLILPDQLGLDPRAIIEDDGNLVGVGDDVIVGDHDASRVDDEP